MKRISEQYPIYTRLHDLPDIAIYQLATSIKNPPFYVGTSSDVEARYKKYVRGMRNNWQLHESNVKLDAFKKLYVPNESPVMVVIDGASTNEDAKQLEKHYRDKYTAKGYSLINSSNGYRGSSKNIAKKLANDGIDAIWDLKTILVIGVLLVGGYIVLRSWA